jgi:hypothetical protein
MAPSFLHKIRYTTMDTVPNRLDWDNQTRGQERIEPLNIFILNCSA